MVLANPAKRDNGHLAVSGFTLDFAGVAGFVLYDTRHTGGRKPFSPQEAFVGAMSVDFLRNKKTGEIESHVMNAAARDGYGSLLYTLAASIFKTVVRPSSDRSAEALEFWRKQPGGVILPLTDEEFQARFGTTPSTLRSRDNATDQEIHGIDLWGGELVARAHDENPPPGGYEPWTMPTDEDPWSKRAWSKRWKANPRDLSGRYIPDRYLAGLPPAVQQQRIRELTASRDAYKVGDFSELPSDRIARKMGLVKESQYTTEAKRRGIEYRGDLRDMAERVFSYYGVQPSAGEVDTFTEALRRSFAKGLAAWKSGGHRPGATAQNWAVARVNSLVVGGKTSWTADKKEFAVLPERVRSAVESQRKPVQKNPALGDDGTLAAAIHQSKVTEAVILLYRVPAPGVKLDAEAAFVGMLMANCESASRVAPNMCVWISSNGAAKRGYGLMLYTLAATLLKAPINPSGNQSKDAARFWGTQAEYQILPLSSKEFESKFGAAPDTLLRRNVLSIDDLSELYRAGSRMIAKSYDALKQVDEFDKSEIGAQVHNLLRGSWSKNDADVSTRIRNMRMRAQDKHAEEMLVNEYPPTFLPKATARIEAARRSAQRDQLQRLQEDGFVLPGRKNPNPPVPLLKVVPAAERVALEAATMDLAPDVRLHLQITKTGCRSFLTHWERREIVVVSDDKNRRCTFYRSFSGTSGKQQGRWYPTAGPSATAGGNALWMVKGSPEKDRGFGRSALVHFENRINEVLPRTDAEVDAWILKLTGLKDGDFFFKDQYECAPTIICSDPDATRADKFLDKYGSHIVQNWKDSTLTRLWGPRDIPHPSDVKKTNPIPELVKGAKTKYKERTKDLSHVADFDRRWDFKTRLENKFGLRFASTWYRLGSGEHWVGVCGWYPEYLDEAVVYRFVAVLQSGKSWSVAENKVVRWLKSANEEPVKETGAGSLDFLKHALSEIRSLSAALEAAKADSLKEGKDATQRFLMVGWLDEKRKRAYSWLKKLGFVEWDGDENYAPCYMKVI